MKNKMKNSAKRGAKRAEYLVRVYHNKVAGNIVDILTDLRHYCDANCLNFHAALAESSEFYRKEKRP